jgi:hypothetical protein
MNFRPQGSLRNPNQFFSVLGVECDYGGHEPP